MKKLFGVLLLFAAMFAFIEADAKFEDQRVGIGINAFSQADNGLDVKTIQVGEDVYTPYMCVKTLIVMATHDDILEEKASTSRQILYWRYDRPYKIDYTSKTISDNINRLGIDDVLANLTLYRDKRLSNDLGKWPSNVSPSSNYYMGSK